MHNKTPSQGQGRAKLRKRYAPAAFTKEAAVGKEAPRQSSQQAVSHYMAHVLAMRPALINRNIYICAIAHSELAPALDSKLTLN